MNYHYTISVIVLSLCFYLSLNLSNPDVNCVAYDSYQRKCTVCISGYEVANGQCVQAKCSISFCKFCADANTCQQCTDYHHLNADNTECRPSVILCQEHYDDNTCKECEKSFTQNNDNTQCENDYSGSCTFDHCVRCTHSTQCGQCEPGFLLRGQECVKEIEDCIEQEYKLCRKCKNGLYPQTLVDLNNEQYSICQADLCANVNIPDCLEMNNDCKCNICSGTNNFLQLDTGLCVYECPSDYYMNEERYTIQGESTYRVKHFCGKCIDNCKECWDATTCQKCNAGYEALNGQCYDDQSQYNNPDVNCVVYDTYQRKCTICLSGFEVENGKCVQAKCSIPFCKVCADATTCQQCVDYHHLNADNTECRPSVILCQEHYDDDTCKECEKSFTQNNDNTQCENGYSGACTFDHCVRCTHSTQCGQCEPGYLLRGQECVKEIENCAEQEYHFCRKCENNLYPLTLSEKYSVCQSDKCVNTRHPYCLVMDDNCQCQACQDFLTDDRECINKCQGSFYILSQTITINYKQYNQKFCSSCIDHCLQCDNGNTCQECESNYQILDEICVEIPNCKNEQKHEITENNIIKCVYPCPSGTVLNTQNNKCEGQTCSVDNCLNYGSNCECQLCDQTYLILKDNQGVTSCVKTCPENYFENEEWRSINGQNQVALFCDSCSIDHCTDYGSNCECKACDQTYFRLTDNQGQTSCVKNCPGSYFENEERLQINGQEKIVLFCDSCSVDYCVDYGSNCECKACNSNYQIVDKKCEVIPNCKSLQKRQIIENDIIKCVSSCPDGTSYFEQSNSCQTCQDTTCLSFGKNCVCEICKTSKFLIKFQEKVQCFDSCTDGYFAQEERVTYNSQSVINQYCTKCIDSCIECDNSNTCKICDNSYFLVDGICIHENELTVECSSNEFKVIENKQEKCVSSCPSNQFAYKNVCYEKCPEGTSLNANNECQDCDTSCLTCSIPNNNLKCTSCDSGKMLQKIYNTNNIYSNIESDDEKESIIVFLAALKLNNNMNEILAELRNTNIDHMDMILELANNPNFLQMVTKFESQAQYSKIIANQYSTIQGLTMDNFASFVNSNSQGLINLEKVLGKNSKSICASICQNGYFNNNGICDVCFKSCRSCTRFGETSCTSCWESFILNSKTSVCESKYIISYSVAALGESGIQSQIAATDSSSDLLSLSRSYSSLYSANSYSTETAFTSEELGLDTDEEKKKEQLEQYNNAQNLKGTVRSALIQQLNTISSISTEKNKESVSDILEIADSIVNISLEESSESEIKEMASLLNKEQLTEQTLENSNIEKALNYVNSIIKAKNAKEKALNEVASQLKEADPKNIKLDETITTEIKNSLDNLVAGFLQNNNNEPIAIENENFAIKLEKATLENLKEKLQASYQIKKVTTDEDEQKRILEEESSTSLAGKLRIDEESIEKLVKQFESLNFGQNKNVLINQIALLDEDLSLDMQSLTKHSNVIDFSFEFINLLNEKQIIKIEDANIQVTLPNTDKEINSTTKKVCKFFDRDTNQWSNQGVKLINSDSQSFTCQTSHLTEFAVVDEDQESLKENESSQDNKKLIIILAICIFGALAIIASSIITLIYLKRKNNRRMQHAKVADISKEEVIIEKI